MRVAIDSGAWAIMKRLVLMIALTCASAPYATADTWDELVAAAKLEGRVVVIGPPDPQVRVEIPTAFKKRFGVTVDYLGGRTNEQVAKLRAERGSGLYTTDVVVAGIGTIATALYPEKMLAPVKPVLFLPEVLDGSRWKRRALWFGDPEEQYVLRLSNAVQPSFYVNTKGAKPSDFKSGRDLFDAKWKGKIGVQDPTTLGSGATFAARIFTAFGEDGLKALYIDQKPAITRDARQVTDWLLRGTYPIVMSADQDEVERMRAEGMPIQSIFGLPGLPASVSAEFGMIALFDKAPHPNAAKVFINWIASREGMELWARARNEVPTRNDIDELSFLGESKIPKPGVDYLDTYDWDFTVNVREKVRLRMKEMLGR
jgi:iron(III) transport system substrate-binding protein